MFGKIGAALTAIGRPFGRALPVVVRDGAGLAAVGLISYGAWQISPPAGFITAGCLLLFGVILISAKKPGKAE
ncbi:hypothetical protein NKH17_12470 [Mesorhizobium sp. M1334]|uniref:hypothetical protein n=1 Tax=Mesorhizobium sp. M1334 TaxID=2957084 RepID=UPI00333903C6